MNDQFDEEIVTDASWPMPPQREWAPVPAPSLRDILRDWARRLKVWLVGEESV